MPHSCSTLLVLSNESGEMIDLVRAGCQAGCTLSFSQMLGAFVTVQDE